VVAARLVPLSVANFTAKRKQVFAHSRNHGRALRRESHSSQPREGRGLAVRANMLPTRTATAGRPRALLLGLLVGFAFAFFHMGSEPPAQNEDSRPAEEFQPSQAEAAIMPSAPAARKTVVPAAKEKEEENDDDDDDGKPSKAGGVIAWAEKMEHKLEDFMEETHTALPQDSDAHEAFVELKEEVKEEVRACLRQVVQCQLPPLPTLPPSDP
jgi:hypothetical protein